MGFFDNIKQKSRNVVKGVSKSIQKIQIDNKYYNEVYQIKRRILMNLGINELKNLSYLLKLDLEYEKYFDEKNFSWEKRKIKVDKFTYIDNIAKTPYAELVLKLRHLRKTALADEMEREIGFVEKRVNEQKENIIHEISNEESEKYKDVLLSTFVKTIIEEIISVNPEQNCKNEREYQIEIKSLLKGVIKHRFPKSKISVEIEYKTKTGKRIDILVQIDGYRLGIETKYNLSSSGSFQRAQGQALEYSEFLDALILVQYAPLENEVGIQNLKELSKIIKIPFNVIANGNVRI